jgi:hypothetical protein
MADEKRYCKGSGKKYVFEDSGNEIINLSVNPSQLAELLVQVNKERESQGQKTSDYLTIRIAEKRTPGEWGDTHYAYVQPYKAYQGGGSKSKATSKPKKKDAGVDKMPWEEE